MLSWANGLSPIGNLRVLDALERRFELVGIHGERIVDAAEVFVFSEVQVKAVVHTDCQERPNLPQFLETENPRVELHRLFAVVHGDDGMVQNNSHIASRLSSIRA